MSNERLLNLNLVLCQNTGLVARRDEGERSIRAYFNQFASVQRFSMRIIRPEPQCSKPKYDRAFGYIRRNTESIPRTISVFISLIAYRLFYYTGQKS